LYDLIEQVNAADRFGNKREDLVESWSTRELDVVVAVDRVSSTFGSVVDDAYQNGQTVQGHRGRDGPVDRGVGSVGRVG
jgi:hypothetical protein